MKKEYILLLAVVTLIIFSGENMYRDGEENIPIFPAAHSFHIFNDALDVRDTHGVKVPVCSNELRSITVALFLTPFINILTTPSAFRYSQGVIMKILHYVKHFVYQYTLPVRRNIGKIASYAIDTLATLCKKIWLLIFQRFVPAGKTCPTAPLISVGKIILSYIISSIILRL